ncbi:hypothetical protein [Pontiella sp.]|uniref:hypothetical protein n=1 Tax=Pontiella sp. TaxID=2837462 RepID=UPI0035635B49
MKKQNMIKIVMLLAIPVIAQTNDFEKGSGEYSRPEWKRPENGGHNGEGGGRQYADRYRNMSPEQKAEREERRLQLMEKTLKEIGVSEEQKTQILELQKKLRNDMGAANLKADEARETLSKLEKSGAAEEVIYAAIDTISEVQSEQMKILAKNKMQLERILGKEKYKQFMNAARTQYQMHGRRGGAGMPTRPDLPPLPDQEKNLKVPNGESSTSLAPPIP